MSYKWTKTWKDNLGNIYKMSENKEIVMCILTTGKVGYGSTKEEAYKNAKTL